MTEDQKKALIAKKLEEKKKELAEKKKAEVEALKQQILAAKKKGDTAELKRLMEVIKGLSAQK